MSCPIEAMAIRGFESHCSENIGQSARSSVDPIHTGEYKVFIGDRSALTSMSFDKTPAVYTPVLRDSPLTWKRKPSAYMSTVLYWAFLSQAWVLGLTSMAQASHGEKPNAWSWRVLFPGL